jgi:hypothetical protein
MDFRQTIQPNRSSAPSSQAPAPAPEGKHEKYDDSGEGQTSVGKWMRIFTFVMLAGIVVLLAAIAYGVGRSPSDNEFKFVDQSKYQAVFLNSGQVYFGNIESMNDKYVHMGNIYYLTQASSSDSSSSSSNNYSLVKLGCQQIHDPYDAMVINRDEVSFWENLQDNGKVVASIKQFKQQNPNGPDCSKVSSQTQATSTNAQGDTTGTSSTTGTGTSTTTTGK